MAKPRLRSPEALLKILRNLGMHAQWSGGQLILKAGEKAMRFPVFTDAEPGPPSSAQLPLPYDLLMREPEKLGAILQSKMGGNQRVFARTCRVERIPNREGEAFLKRYHLMGSTTCAWTYALFKQNELLALASFSKGRKMKRLPVDQRSYELIRFCSRPGITVTGGLSKIVKRFVQDRGAGDIMTYVDAAWSSGESFVKAGFEPAGQSAPREYLVNRSSLERRPRNEGESVPKGHYLCRDLGNIKLIYHAGKAL